MPRRAGAGARRSGRDGGRTRRGRRLRPLPSWRRTATSTSSSCTTTATVEVDAHGVAEQVWYPLWDAGANIDHSVRALSEVTVAARRDPRVALGLLDARHLAGDPSVTLRLRADLLSHWRRDARDQLPALRELVTRRGARQGELAHASVPDLKESVGGLRDATVLKALVATWLVDVSHADLEPSRLQLLDVRDVLHEVTGRSADRVAPEVWPDLAERLGLPDAEAAQRHVREIGRRITHLSRLTWHRVDAVLARPRAARRAGTRPGAGRARCRRVAGRGRAGPGHQAGRRPAAAAALLPPRPPSGSWCWPRRRQHGWPATAHRCRSPGPARRGTCSPGCSPPDPACCPCGRRWTRRGPWTGCCRSGTGSGCCRTPRWCTASPWTGTWSRPAPRPPG